MTSIQSAMNIHTSPEMATEAPQFVTPGLLERPSEPQAIGQTSLSSSTTIDEGSKSDAKAVKKRKSWGQELPEPTTNLPPRKRAKTEAEREQRRIERVKRNRQAAHNSRERKRQEHDVILDEKNELARQVQSLAKELAEAKAIIAHLTGNKMIPATVVAPAPTSVSDQSTPTPSIFSSSNNTPVLSVMADFTSPQTEYAQTPELVSNKDFESTQQSAVSFDSLLAPNQKVAVLDYSDNMASYAPINMDSFFGTNFSEDFTLFEDAKSMPIAPTNSLLTPFDVISTSPLSGAAMMTPAMGLDTNDHPFGEALFSDVQFNSGAAYASDE